MRIAGLFIIAFAGIVLTALIGLAERFLFFRSQAAEEDGGEEVTLLHRKLLKCPVAREKKSMDN